MGYFAPSEEKVDVEDEADVIKTKKEGETHVRVPADKIDGQG